MAKQTTKVVYHRGDMRGAWTQKKVMPLSLASNEGTKYIGQAKEAVEIVTDDYPGSWRRVKRGAESMK